MPISTFLNGRTPSRLRGLQFLAFSDSAVVQRRTATSDSGGGASWTWAAAGSAVPCRMWPVSIRGQGRLVGGALDEHTTHFCAMPAGESVGAPDRLVIAGRGTFDVTLALERTDALTRVVEVMQVNVN